MIKLKSIPVSFIILGLYLFLSGYFAFERILNTDNSYYFFNIVNNQSFWVAEHRYGVLPSQIPLLFLTFLKAPITILIYVYSITFALEYTVLALCCYYCLGVKEVALAIALVLITGIAYSFFHPVTETYHSLLYALLLYAVLVSKKFTSKNIFYYPLIAAASLLSLLSHPVGGVIVGFVTLFALVSKQIRPFPFIFLFAITVLATFIKVLFVSPESYDHQQYQNLFTFFNTGGEWPALYPFTFFISRLTSTYFSFGLILPVFVIICLQAKEYQVLLISLFCSLVFGIMSIFTFSKGDLDMMMEKTFMPSLFMIILPFSYLCSKQFFWSQARIQIVLIICLVMGFRQILSASSIVSKRLEVLESIAALPLPSKLIANYSDFNNALIFNNWNTGIDSYIIAGSKQHKAFTLFLTDHKESFEFDSTDTRLFLGTPFAPFWNKPLLNKTYFNLPDIGYKVYPSPWAKPEGLSLYLTIE
jgi:hypothetical protein